MGMMRNANKILTGKPEGKRPLGKSGHRWEDNIKIELRGKNGEKVWTRFISLRIGTSCGLLWTR
jgi:hypothetical protein